MITTLTRRFTSLLVLTVVLVASLLSVTPVFAENEGTAEYIVRTGDNLTKIARRFELTVDQIMAVNPQIRDVNNIRRGQVIILPVGRGEGKQDAEFRGRILRWEVERDGRVISGEDRLYLVRSGDNLNKIAKAYGITLEQLLDANPQIDDVNQLFRGELIRIPEGIGENVPPFYVTPPVEPGEK